MYSEVDNWFYKYVGGLDFENGNVVIKPYIISNINNIKVSWRDVEIVRNKDDLSIKTGRTVKLILNNETKELCKGSYQEV